MWSDHGGGVLESSYGAAQQPLLLSLQARKSLMGGVPTEVSQCVLFFVLLQTSEAMES